MVVSVNHRLAFLVVVLHVIFLSGCSFFGDPGDPMEALREQVRATVADPDRADEMLAAVDRIDQLLIEIADVLAEVARQEQVLLLDYDSTPQDFEALLSEATRRRKKLQQAALDAHLEFKAEATADEWQALLPAHASAITMRVESLLVAAIAERV
jgi:Fic family protein